MTQLGYQDPIVSYLQANSIPVTLENWLAHAYPDDPPEAWWTETEVPLELQAELETYLDSGSPFDRLMSKMAQTKQFPTDLQPISPAPPSTKEEP